MSKETLSYLTATWNIPGEGAGMVEVWPEGQLLSQEIRGAFCKQSEGAFLCINKRQQSKVPRREAINQIATVDIFWMKRAFYTGAGVFPLQLPRVFDKDK